MDLDFLHLTLPLIFSFFVSISILLFFFVYGRTKFQPNYNIVVPVIEITRNLEKICPINGSNKWKLFPSEHGCQRCWYQSFSLPTLKKDIDVYGSAITLNASSVNVCSLIADVTKWPEWNPHHNYQYIVKSFHDKQLRKDFFMEAEQIFSIVRDDVKIQSHLFMYRFRDFSENKIGWILFWNPKKLDFSYFLIQPIKDKNEKNPMCLLTHIMGNDSKFLSSSISLVSQRLRNIKDIILFSSLCIPPSVTSKSEDTATQNKPQTLDSNNKSQPSGSNNQENYFSLPSVRARKRDVRNTLFVLVPFISPLHAFLKSDIEFKLAVRNKDGDKKSLNPKESNKVESLPKQNLLRRTISDATIKSKISNENQDSCTLDSAKAPPLSKTRSASMVNCKKAPNHNSDTTSEDSEAKKNHLSKGQMLSHFKLKSYSDTAVNNLRNCENSNQLIIASKKCESNHKLEDITENIENNLLAIDEQGNKLFTSSISDFEIVENCEFTENRIAGFLTQGNYGAAELQAEAYLASLCVDDMISGNFQSSSGWAFHSYHKGLSVFTKTSSNKFLKICSFLCQSEIAAAPKDVWRFVKNPQFRFICDESVKSVEVLEKISTSQKLIHTYHEINGFIKKELMDFCLLQTEREEANKCYSCFCSVEFDKCPFMKSVTRGTMRPSGWIVEKIEKDINKSLVTYMMQVLINSPDGLFIQELSTIVPQSVHNLKNYIMSKPM